MIQSNQQLYDPIRKQWVADEPEERVRQGLIRLMTEQLGYPAELLVAEKALKQLPHVAMSGENPPNRRLDLLCMARGIHPTEVLFPLLLVECKAVPLTQETERQVIGYNRFVQAPFLTIVNQTQLKTGAWDPTESAYVFQRGLPRYEELIARLT